MYFQNLRHESLFFLLFDCKKHRIFVVFIQYSYLFHIYYFFRIILNYFMLINQSSQSLHFSFFICFYTLYTYMVKLYIVSDKHNNNYLFSFAFASVSAQVQRIYSYPNIVLSQLTSFYPIYCTIRTLNWQLQNSLK